MHFLYVIIYIYIYTFIWPDAGPVKNGLYLGVPRPGGWKLRPVLLKCQRLSRKTHRHIPVFQKLNTILLFLLYRWIIIIIISILHHFVVLSIARNYSVSKVIDLYVLFSFLFVSEEINLKRNFMSKEFS